MAAPRRRWRDHALTNRIAAALLAASIATAAPARTDDGSKETVPSPFPNPATIIAWFVEQSPQDYFTAKSPGVWFSTPSGLTCGIWKWGSFGCTGDIPGAPPGDNHIAWFNGNRAVHHGWSAAIQFPAGQAERGLPPRSYVSYDSTTCAITPDSNVYCGHGDFEFLITPQGTWLKGWDDRRSYVCNFYNSCPRS